MRPSYIKYFTCIQAIMDLHFLMFMTSRNKIFSKMIKMPFGRKGGNVHV